MDYLNGPIPGIDDNGTTNIDAAKVAINNLRHMVLTARSERDAELEVTKAMSQQIVDARQLNDNIAEQIASLKTMVEAERKRANELTSDLARATDRSNEWMVRAMRAEGYVDRVRETDGKDLERRHRALHGRRRDDRDNSRREPSR